MSMLWLVGVADPWLTELFDLLSGQFPVRRVITVENFCRLAFLEQKKFSKNVMCVVKVNIDLDPMSLHSTFSRILKVISNRQICIVGLVTDAQRKILSNFNIAYLGTDVEHYSIARTLTNLIAINSNDEAQVFDNKCLQVGDIEINRAESTVKIQSTGAEELLTPKELKILQLLSLNPNKTIDRGELVQSVWASTHVSSSTIDSHISRLRKKIDQSFECRIETIYGSGWSLVTKEGQI